MTTNTPARETQHTAMPVHMTKRYEIGYFNRDGSMTMPPPGVQMVESVDHATAYDWQYVRAAEYAAIEREKTALQAQNEALVAALRAACNALSELATSLPGGQAQIFADNAADAASAALRAAQEPPHG